LNQRSAAALILATVAFMLWAKVPWDTALGRALQDASHVIASGVVALASLTLIRPRLASRGSARALAWPLAFLATFLAGGLVELGQALGARSPSAVDLLRDGAGAAAFLLLAFALGADARGVRARAPIRAGAALVAIALWGAAWADLASWISAYARRDRSFPVLCRFDRPESLRFASANGVALEFTDPPRGWTEAAGHPVARLRLEDVHDPGVSLEEPYPDWRGYSALVLDAYNPEESPLPLALRVHDARHDGRYLDRFNRLLVLVPGPNRLRIPLSEIETAPEGRLLDLSRIAGVILFAPGTDRPRTVYLDALALE